MSEGISATLPGPGRYFASRGRISDKSPMISALAIFTIVPNPTTENTIAKTSGTSFLLSQCVIIVVMVTS